MYKQIFQYMSVPYKTQNLRRMQNGVPYSIYHRAGAKANDQGDTFSSKKRARKQYEETVVSDLVNIERTQRRAQISIKNTPKIAIINQNAHGITVSVQCPKQSLIENLKTHNRIIQLGRILQAILALFKLAEIHGYFYCDKLMLKCSEDGSPIVWINQNFLLAERQFPIRECSVSELIFIKKIKNTISDIVTFPKDFQIQTKNDLIQYIETAFNSFPDISIKKETSQLSPPKLPFTPKQRFSVNQAGLRFAKSKSPFSGKFPFSQKSNKDLTSERTAKNLTFKGATKHIQFHHVAKKSSKGKINSQLIKGRRKRLQTTAFVKNEAFSTGFRQVFMKQNQQYSSRSQIVKNQKGEQNSYEIAPKKELGMQSNQSHGSNADQNQNEETINQQFNFEQQLMEKPKDKTIDKKSRKQSADPNPFQSWLKSSDKFQEKTFQNSTFSTRVTFSSMKGQFESVSDHGESKEKKRDSPKQDNHTIPHLYSTDKQKQSKQKFNAHIRKIMKESGLKIKEEDSFENEVENLFESKHPNKLNLQRQKILRESELMSQFQKLFVSSHEQEKQVYIDDFQNILG